VIPCPRRVFNFAAFVFYNTIAQHTASAIIDVAALQAELAEARAALAFERDNVVQLRAMLSYKKLSANSAPSLPSIQASKLSLIAVNQLAGHMLGQLDCSGGDRPSLDSPNAVHMSNSLGTSRMILKSISRFVQSLASRFAPMDLSAYTRSTLLLQPLLCCLHTLGRSLQCSVKGLDDVSTLDAAFAIAFLSFDTANRLRITEQPGLLLALVNLLDPNATDSDSTFADEHDLVIRFALSAISQLALDRSGRVALCNLPNTIKFVFARSINDSKEVYIRMTAMIALSNLLLESSVCEAFLRDESRVSALVATASTVPVVDDVKRKSSASLSLDYALNALYNLCSSPAWVSSKFKVPADAQQRLIDIAAGNSQLQSVFLADRIASCIDPLRSLNYPDTSPSPFSFPALPGSASLGGVAGDVGGFFSDVFAKTKSGLSSVGDATGISKAVDAAASGLDKAKSSVASAIQPSTAPSVSTPASDDSSVTLNPFARAFDAVKSGVTAIGDKVVDVAKAGADVAKSGVVAAADATSAGFSMAVDAAKAGADAAKTGVSSAASAAAQVVPGSSRSEQVSNTAAALPPVAPELQNGPSVKALAGKFVVLANPDSQRQLSSARDRPTDFPQHKENTLPPPALFHHRQQPAVFDVPTATDSEVYHC
jgi:hypothetical protein